MPKEAIYSRSGENHSREALRIVAGVTSLIEGKNPGDPEIMAFSDLIDFTRADIVCSSRGIRRRNDRKKALFQRELVRARISERASGVIRYADSIKLLGIAFRDLVDENRHMQEEKGRVNESRVQEDAWFMFSSATHSVLSSFRTGFQETSPYSRMF